MGWENSNLKYLYIWQGLFCFFLFFLGSSHTTFLPAQSSHNLVLLQIRMSKLGSNNDDHLKMMWKSIGLDVVGTEIHFSDRHSMLSQRGHQPLQPHIGITILNIIDSYSFNLCTEAHFQNRNAFPFSINENVLFKLAWKPRVTSWNHELSEYKSGLLFWYKMQSSTNKRSSVEAGLFHTDGPHY